MRRPRRGVLGLRPGQNAAVIVSPQMRFGGRNPGERTLSRWLVRDQRLRDDPLVGVTGYNAQEDPRHERRTIGLDELRRLIAAAHDGPAYKQMTGPARALCYRLAVASGLRFSEFASLTPQSFHAAAVTIQAAYSKDSTTATLPLSPDVANEMAAWIETIPAGAPVFPLPDRGAAMLKVDLKAAGIA